MVEVSREERGLTLGLTSDRQLHDYSTDLKGATTQGLDKRTSRIWPATYACIVAAVGFLVLGYSMGYNSPVSSHLKHRKGYTSLRRTVDQDLFAVSGVVLWLASRCQVTRGFLYSKASNQDARESDD